MLRIFWEGLLCMSVAGLSWWILLAQPADKHPKAYLTPTPALKVTPSQRQEGQANLSDQESASPQPPTPHEEPLAMEEAQPESMQQSQQEEPDEPSSSGPPPPELGQPDGQDDASRASLESSGEESTAADLASSVIQQVRNTMADQGLLSQAAAELSGQAAKGFETVFVSSPKDQFDIAKFFGEEVVLVPKSAFRADENQASYYRLDLMTGQVETIRGREALQNFRQYRDLFAYPHSELPSSIRALRRKVIKRSEIYLFGALHSRAEWALVISRRQRALADSPTPGKPVRRYELAYERLPHGGFDLVVRRILFEDGSSFLPSDS